jgi:LysR family transcriptional activator of dmlA
MKELTSASVEMAFFSLLMNAGSLTAAARELGISPPAATRRLNLLEERLGVSLLARTTRRMSLTAEGEEYLRHARRVLSEIQDFEHYLAKSMVEPQGLLRVNATLGFGRSHIAPLISTFYQRYPKVHIELQLTVNPPLVSDNSFDVCIRFGEPPDSRMIARKLADNRRLLCAAPAYLEKYGKPKTPRDLARHHCIAIRHGDEAHGLWRLSSAQGVELAKINGPLVTNDGDIAVQWALDGLGIIMRAEWDISRYLESGRLQVVLKNYRTPEANIYAVYPQRHQMARRVRVFVDFLSEAFAGKEKVGGTSGLSSC